MFQLKFKEWLIYLEGAADQQALSILKTVPNSQEVVQSLKQAGIEPKYLPIFAYFYLNGDKNINTLHQYYDKLQGLVNRKKLNVSMNRQGVTLTSPGGTINQIAWLKFTEVIDGLHNTLSSPKKAGANDGVPEDAKPIFSKNGLDIYEANSPQACIKYGQGYSFCISKAQNRMWQSYRDTQTSTFYFVFDRTKDKSDPLHIVVVDMAKNGPSLTDANNTTGHIAHYGKDANAYLKDLYARDVPSTLFKNIPKTRQEEDEQVRLGKATPSDKWFQALSPEDKSKYIGRGHPLSDAQFDLLWDANAMALLSQYVNIGQKLPPYQMNKVFSNNQLSKSYLRMRVIANEHTHDIAPAEVAHMAPEQREKLKEQITKLPPFDALSKAKRLGMQDLVDSLHDKVREEILKLRPMDAMIKARELGHHDLVDSLHDSTDFDDKPEGALARASEHGFTKTVQHLLQKHSIEPFHLGNALSNAAKAGELDVVKHILNHAATLPLDNLHPHKPPFDDDYLQHAKDAANRNQHSDIADFISDYQQKQQDDALDRVLGQGGGEGEPAAWG